MVYCLWNSGKRDVFSQQLGFLRREILDPQQYCSSLSGTKINCCSETHTFAIFSRSRKSRWEEINSWAKCLACISLNICFYVIGFSDLLSKWSPTVGSSPRKLGRGQNISCLPPLTSLPLFLPSVSHMNKAVAVCVVLLVIAVVLHQFVQFRRLLSYPVCPVLCFVVIVHNSNFIQLTSGAT